MKSLLHPLIIKYDVISFAAALSLLQNSSRKADPKSSKVPNGGCSGNKGTISLHIYIVFAMWSWFLNMDIVALLCFNFSTVVKLSGTPVVWINCAVIFLCHGKKYLFPSKVLAYLHFLHGIVQQTVEVQIYWIVMASARIQQKKAFCWIKGAKIARPPNLKFLILLSLLVVVSVSHKGR